MFLFGAAAGVALLAAAMVPTTRLLLRRAELRAREAERRARQSERLAELGTMTSGLAHEIKNPLSTVGLNAQLLAEEIADSDIEGERRERILKRIGTLGREAERLRNILTDFLRFAGRMKLDRGTYDLRTVVEELADFLAPQCQQSGVLLRTDLPPAPLTCEVDPNLLKQALLNLMLNAIQAMAPPSASPTAASPEPWRRGELMLRVESDPAEARIHVIDTGPGIEPADLERIFQPYVSGKPGGTGLGLPTARRIVEEHGGRLVAHSRKESGSDFVIALPRTRAGPTRSP